MIEFRLNLIFTLSNTLSAIKAKKYYGNETENGVEMALFYLNSLNTDYLSDQELRHALRLTMYRGKERNYQKLYTA